MGLGVLLEDLLGKLQFGLGGRIIFNQLRGIAQQHKADVGLDISEHLIRSLFGLNNEILGGIWRNGLKDCLNQLVPIDDARSVHRNGELGDGIEFLHHKVGINLADIELHDEVKAAVDLSRAGRKIHTTDTHFFFGRQILQRQREDLLVDLSPAMEPSVDDRLLEQLRSHIFDILGCKAVVGGVLRLDSFDHRECDLRITSGRIQECVIVLCRNRQLYGRANSVERTDTLRDLDRRKRLNGRSVSEGIVLCLDLVLIRSGNLRNAARLHNRAARDLARVADKRILAVVVIKDFVLRVQFVSNLRAEHCEVDSRNAFRADLTSVCVNDLDHILTSPDIGGKDIRDWRKRRIVVHRSLTELSGGGLDEVLIPSVIDRHSAQFYFSQECAAIDDSGPLEISSFLRECDLIIRLQGCHARKVLDDVRFFNFGFTLLSERNNHPLALRDAGVIQELREVSR